MWVEYYPCVERCAPDGNWSRHERSLLNCSREDLPEVPWEAPAGADWPWMGLPEMPHAYEGGGTFLRPSEPSEHGCPGGWIRCPFAESLVSYLPTLAGETWMESPLIREAPPLVIEAVQLWKLHRARSESHFTKVSRQSRG